jgi:molecular chaperone Hsp33
LVRLDDVLGEVLAAHAYPPVIERTLAEALVLTALLGASLKEPGSQLTLQTQTEKGAIRLLACDYKDGALRGYAQFDAATAAALPRDATLFGVFGQGYLAITFDRMKPASEGGGRYQGIVPLEGETLADAAQNYFMQSEQIPTFIRVAVDRVDGRCVAGGHCLDLFAFGDALAARQIWIALVGQIGHDLCFGGHAAGGVDLRRVVPICVALD